MSNDELRALAEASMRGCSMCAGEGRLIGHGIDPIEMTCPECDGSGDTPAPIMSADPDTAGDWPTDWRDRDAAEAP